MVYMLACYALPHAGTLQPGGRRWHRRSIQSEQRERHQGEGDRTAQTEQHIAQLPPSSKLKVRPGQIKSSRVKWDPGSLDRAALLAEPGQEGKGEPPLPRPPPRPPPPSGHASDDRPASGHASDD